MNYELLIINYELGIGEWGVGRKNIAVFSLIRYSKSLDR